MNDPEDKGDISRLQRQKSGKLSDALGSQLSDLTKVAQVARTTISTLVSAVSPVVGFLVSQPWAEIAERIAEAAKELPSKHQQAMKMLADRGWYFDEEMAFTMPLDLVDVLVNEGGEEEAEAALREHFSGRLDSIESFLVDQLSDRARILGQAFSAHRAGQYALSTPVFLMQADGVCVAKTGRYFFMRRRDKLPQTATYVQSKEREGFEAAWLSPLAAIGQVNMSEDQRGADFVGLNRHLVIHGESIDYDTETNSLKALSLLNYVVQMLVRDQSEGFLAV
ncbi:hypothetical protein [Cupriavidus necator]|nr:hypothetical protein [Cupriavidus necator]MDX6008399.1 hypothetical protein [Cupriavidus necator]